MNRYANVGRRPLPPHLRHVPEPGNYVAKVRHWHREIVDFFLQHPTANQNDCATHFEKSAVWISKVMTSDAFREYYSKRMAEHHQLVSQEIVSSTQHVAKEALGIMHEKLSNPATRELVPLNAVKDIGEMTLKALGFGAARAPSVNIDARSVSFGDVSPEVLANARVLMQQVAQNNTQEIEEPEDAAARIESAGEDDYSYEMLPPE